MNHFDIPFVDTHLNTPFRVKLVVDVKFLDGTYKRALECRILEYSRFKLKLYKDYMRKEVEIIEHVDQFEVVGVSYENC